MSELEVRAASVLDHVTDVPAQISSDDWLLLGAWLLKTYFVMGLRVDSFQAPFSDTGLRSKIFPNPRQALALRDGRWEEALALVEIGVAQHEPLWRVFAFGNAETRPPEFQPLVGVFVMGFAAIHVQLWLVNSAIPGARIEFPEAVSPLRPGLRWQDRLAGANPDPFLVTANFSAK